MTMLSNTRRSQVSKTLSYALRHRPDKFGLTLDEHGYATVEAVLTALNTRLGAKPGDYAFLTPDDLDVVVRLCDKQRYAYSEDRTRIRANQGHSVDVDLGLAASTPPATLYHGTADKHLDSIRELGLLKGKRQHVHLSTDKTTAKKVGARHGSPVVLDVFASAMHLDGFKFYLSANDIWLTDHVPSKYLACVEQRHA